MGIELLPKHVQLMLQQIADENGFKDARTEFVSELNQGENFMGQVYRVALHDDAENGKKSINLIIKCAPENPKRRELLRIKCLFDREIFMYERVFPALLNVLKAKGLVPETQETCPSTPKCYKTRNSEDGGEGTVILKDISPEGFKMVDRFSGLDAEHCRVVLREQAKFHASTILLRETDPQTFQRLKESCPEILFVPEWITPIEGFADKVRGIIDTRFPNGTPVRAKFEEFTQNYYKNMEEQTAAVHRLSAFCHGDNWSNNILFKYGKNPSVPDELCFIDFQLSRHAVLVTDVSQMIFCSTTKALRDIHFKGLLKDYHRFLCGTLKDFGCSDESIVSWDVMQDLYNKHMKFGIGMSYITIPIITANAGDLHSSNEVGDASQMDEVFKSKAESNPICTERMGDAVLDAIEYGYI